MVFPSQSSFEKNCFPYYICERKTASMFFKIYLFIYIFNFYFYFIKAFMSGCKPRFCHVLHLMEGFVATEAEEHHLTTPLQST